MAISNLPKEFFLNSCHISSFEVPHVCLDQVNIITLITIQMKTFFNLKEKLVLTIFINQHASEFVQEQISSMYPEALL